MAKATSKPTNTNKPAETITVGERYVNLIKVLYAQTSDIKIPAHVDLPEYQKAINAFIKYLGFPKSVKLECSIETFTGYHPVFKINGKELHLQQTQISSKVKEVQTFFEARRKRDSLNANKCQELELLNEVQGGAAINKFKAFVKAKYDRLSYAERITPAKFKATVKEFLNTQRKHTCPL